MTARTSASAAAISSTDSPVSMAIRPSGPSMNVWLERPLPTRHHTPLRTSQSFRESRSVWASRSRWIRWPPGPVAVTDDDEEKLAGR